LCFSDGLLLLLAGETKTKRKEIAAVCLWEGNGEGLSKGFEEE
jgi:hypothetical protein